MSIRIERCEGIPSPEESAAFISVGKKLQRTHQQWVALASNFAATATSANFPFHHYGDVAWFVAYTGDEPVGRCAAGINYAMQDDSSARLGFIGLWECIDDDWVARELLESATAWLRDQSVASVIGPMDFSTWYSYRFVVARFDHPHVLGEPSNPPWYPTQWECFGFAPTHHYYSSKIALPDVPAELLNPGAKRFHQLIGSGYTLRHPTRSSFQSDLRHVYELALEEFAESPFFTRISWEEFAALYQGFERMMVPELIQILHDPAGNVAAVLFGLPNYAEAIASMRGSTSHVAKLRFAWNRRHFDGASVKTLVVRKELQLEAIGFSLVMGPHHDFLAAMNDATSYQLLMHQDNHSVAMTDRAGTKTFREYALLEMSI